MLAAIAGGCIGGGGIDLITCADMRYCASDAFFTIKEIDIGMADVIRRNARPLVGLPRHHALNCLHGTPGLDARPRRARIGLVNRFSTAARGAACRGAGHRSHHCRQVAAVDPRHRAKCGDHARDHNVADSLELHRHLERGHAGTAKS